MANPQTVLIGLSGLQPVTKLRAAFEQRGWKVQVAYDTLTTFHHAMKTNPEVVLISSALPGGGGLFLLKRMRQFVQTAPIPVITIIERDGPTREALTAAGASHCLYEHFEFSSLFAAIQVLLEISTTVREAPEEAIRNPERLTALKRSGLLDSPPTESFDELTRLATSLLGTPVALVSLVDESRQFFKSQMGLAEPWASLRQTPLSHSFCQWVVTSQDELVIADARQHRGLLSNLAVRDLGVVAYAGMPISAPGGEMLGSFCAIDVKPHQWSDEDLAILRDLSRIAEAYTILEIGQDLTPTPVPGEHDIEVTSQIINLALSCAGDIVSRRGPQLPGTQTAMLENITNRLKQVLAQLIALPA